jgi:uncharacterized protein (TIGR01777 family)
VLCRQLAGRGYDIVVLSRSPERGATPFGSHVKVIGWDARSAAGWAEYADGAQGIINLSGENIAAGRWTPAREEKILQSRLAAGRAIVNALGQVSTKPRVVIQASGIGYYGNRGDELLDENSSSGTGFLADVARDWERSTARIEDMGIRHVIIRTGIVLGPDGGFLSRVLLPFRLFMGGHMGSGRQWLSWIHIKDEVDAICFLLEKPELHGPFNLCSPNPLVARDFFRVLGNAMGRPSWLPVPGFALRILFGQMAEELILSGQRALPKRLLEAGFAFRYPEVDMALRDIVA